MKAKFCENKIIPNAIYVKPGEEIEDFYYDPEMTKVARAKDFKSIDELYALTIVVVDSTDGSVVLCRPEAVSCSISTYTGGNVIRFSYKYKGSSGRFVSTENELRP